MPVEGVVVASVGGGAWVGSEAGLGGGAPSEREGGAPFERGGGASVMVVVDGSEVAGRG